VLIEHSLRHFAQWLDSCRAIHLAVLLRVAALAFLARQPLLGNDTRYYDFAVRLLQGNTIYPLVPPAERIVEILKREFLARGRHVDSIPTRGEG
jgi:hypothetical protein